MTSYANKTAVIVGGGHGIGLATAENLLNRGSKVLITGWSPGPIQSAREKLGDKAKIISCDIASTAAISDLVQAVEAHFESETSLDLLFINAGYAAIEPFTQVTEDSYRRQFATNVFGTFFTAQRLANMMKSGGSMSELMLLHPGL